MIIIMRVIQELDNNYNDGNIDTVTNVTDNKQW